MVTNPQPSKEKIAAYYPIENYISHSSKSSSLVDNIYLLTRKFTLGWKLRILNNNAIKGKVLDVGCGTGNFLGICQKAGWDISGVETSQDARALAIQRTSVQIVDDISKLKDNKYDVITLWHVLEHLHDLNESLSQLKEMLANQGTLIIALPNVASYDSRFYKSFWAGYDVPRHLWHFSKNSFQRLAQNHGLNVVKIIPMKLDSFYVSLLSEKYRAGKASIGGFARAFVTGVRSNWRARKENNYSSLIYIVRL